MLRLLRKSMHEPLKDRAALGTHTHTCTYTCTYTCTVPMHRHTHFENICADYRRSIAQPSRAKQSSGNSSRGAAGLKTRCHTKTRGFPPPLFVSLGLLSCPYSVPWQLCPLTRQQCPAYTAKSNQHDRKWLVLQLESIESWLTVPRLLRPLGAC